MDQTNLEEPGSVTPAETFRQMLKENRASEPGFVLAFVGDIPENSGLVATLCLAIQEVKNADGDATYRQIIQLKLSTQKSLQDSKKRCQA